MTEILCRIDHSTKPARPVVFIPSTLDAGSMLAWTSGTDTNVVTLDFYHSTGALSAHDEEVLKSRFAKATNTKDVRIRHRLPRVARVLENVLSRPGRPPATSTANNAPVILPVKVKGKPGPKPKAKPAPTLGGPVPSAEAQAIAALQEQQAQILSTLNALMALATPKQQA